MGEMTVAMIGLTVKNPCEEHAHYWALRTAKEFWIASQPESPTSCSTYKSATVSSEARSTRRQYSLFVAVTVRRFSQAIQLRLPHSLSMTARLFRCEI